MHRSETATGQEPRHHSIKRGQPGVGRLAMPPDVTSMLGLPGSHTCRAESCPVKGQIWHRNTSEARLVQVACIVVEPCEREAVHGMLHIGHGTDHLTFRGCLTGGLIRARPYGPLRRRARETPPTPPAVGEAPCWRRVTPAWGNPRRLGGAYRSAGAHGHNARDVGRRRSSPANELAGLRNPSGEGSSWHNTSGEEPGLDFAGRDAARATGHGQSLLFWYTVETVPIGLYVDWLQRRGP